MTDREKLAGGEILGRLAGLASRPFVGASKSQGVQKAVTGGLTRYVNQPIERGLRAGGVHRVLGEAINFGMTPIPGTPKMVLPVMKNPVERAVYSQTKADRAVKTLSENPEIIGGAAIPLPGTTETILGAKHLIRKALGVKTAHLNNLLDGFSDELEKTAEVVPYQQKTQWSCSGSCLKAVVAHHGVRIPEIAAIELVGARPGRGAETDQIAAAARKLGFLAFEYSFESIEQAKFLLDQGLPIICDIQSFNHPGKGHYVVLVSADEKRVELMDPNTPGNWRVISHAEMNARWWDRAMAPPHEMMWKWGIVIVPPETAGSS